MDVGQRRRSHVIIVLVVGLSGRWAAAGAEQYTITDLGPLPTATASYAAGINSGGVAVGGTGTAPFLYYNGVLTPLSLYPGASWARAFAINDSAEVTGYGHGQGGYRAFVSSQGVTTSLGVLPEFSPGDSFAFDINNAGQIVGNCVSHANQARRAFLYSGDQLINLGTLPQGYTSSAFAINNLGQIVGSAVVESETRGFVISAGVMQELPGPAGAVAVEPLEINDLGEIVGVYRSTPNQPFQPFLYRDGVSTPLDAPPGPLETFCQAINLHNEMVGFSRDPGAYRAALLWRGGVSHDLNDLIDPSSSWRLVMAADINDLGQIVGEGLFDPDGAGSEPAVARGYLLTPIPEPGLPVVLSATMVVCFARTLTRREA